MRHVSISKVEKQFHMCLTLIKIHFLKQTIFWSSFSSQQKSWRYRPFLLPNLTSFSRSQYTIWSAFVTTDDPAVTHRCPPKSHLVVNILLCFHKWHVPTISTSKVVISPPKNPVCSAYFSLSTRAPLQPLVFNYPTVGLF
jgi:hypothetical protein